jgi:hypothetical protein
MPNKAGHTAAFGGRTRVPQPEALGALCDIYI